MLRGQEDNARTHPLLPSAPWGPRPSTGQSASMPDLQPWECLAFIHRLGKASTLFHSFIKAPGSPGAHGNGINQQFSTLSYNNPTRNYGLPCAATHLVENVSPAQTRQLQVTWHSWCACYTQDVLGLTTPGIGSCCGWTPALPSRNCPGLSLSFPPPCPSSLHRCYAFSQLCFLFFAVYL